MEQVIVLTFVEEVIEEQRLELRVLVVRSGDVAKEHTLNKGVNWVG